MAGERLGTAVLELRTDGSKLDQGLDEAKHSTERTFSQMATAAAASALTFGAVVAVVGKLVEAAKACEQAFFEAEQADAKLNAVLRSTGGVAGMTAGQLKALASEIQKTTGFSDDMVLNAETVLLTFTSVGKEVFPAATKAAVDLTAVLGQDLQSSVIMLGKALNDPIQGISALRRVGVQLTEQQESAVRAAMEQNDILTAQGIILEEVNRQVGGAAVAMGDTAAGAAKKLKEAMGDLQEAQGEAIAQGMRPFREWLTKIVEGLAESTANANALKEVLARGFDDATTPLETLIAAAADLEDKLERMRRGAGLRSQGESMWDIAVQEEQLRKIYEQIRLLQTIAKLREDGSDAAAEEAQLNQQLIDYLARVNKEYAKTPEGKLKALLGEIAYWEAVLPNAVQTRDAVEAILRMLREDLPKETGGVAGALGGLLTQTMPTSPTLLPAPEKVAESVDAVTTTLRTGSDAWREMVGGVTDAYGKMVEKTGNYAADMAEQTTESWEQTANKILDVTRQLTAGLQDVFSAYFDWRLATETLSQDQIAKLTQDGTEESRKILVDNAKKIGKIKHDQLAAEKAAALISIAIDTASAIVKTLASLPFPANAIAAAAIGALGAAQFALVAATPVPSAASLAPQVPELPAAGGSAGSPTGGGGGGGGGDMGAGANYSQERPIMVTILIKDNVIAGDGSFRDLALAIKAEIESVDQLGL